MRAGAHTAGTAHVRARRRPRVHPHAGVSGAGAVLLIVVGILLAVRRQRILLAVPLLTALYLLALGAAWIAMSGKP